jgi:hypothetical protein
MSSIVRPAGAGVVGVPFAIVSDYICSRDQKQRSWRLLKQSTDMVELLSQLMCLINSVIRQINEAKLGAG